MSSVAAKVRWVPGARRAVPRGAPRCRHPARPRPPRGSCRAGGSPETLGTSPGTGAGTTQACVPRPSRGWGVAPAGGSLSLAAPMPPKQPHTRGWPRAAVPPLRPADPQPWRGDRLQRRPHHRPGHSTRRALFAGSAKSVSEVDLSGMDLYNRREFGSAVSVPGGFSSAEMPCACPRAKSAASFKGSRSFEWKNCSVKICTRHVCPPRQRPEPLHGPVKGFGFYIVPVLVLRCLSYSVVFHSLPDPSAFQYQAWEIRENICCLVVLRFKKLSEMSFALVPFPR